MPEEKSRDRKMSRTHWSMVLAEVPSSSSGRATLNNKVERVRGRYQTPASCFCMPRHRNQPELKSCRSRDTLGAGPLGPVQ